MREIFGLGRPWNKVKNDFTNVKIRDFYLFIAQLWPPDTDFRELLPRPDNKLRALYLGENEPELMLHNVFRFALYADQIVLINPFQNPNVVAEKYNPIVHPEEWKLQTLRVVYHLSMLAPWVHAGLVTLIPDPGDFDQELRLKTWELAAERLKNWTPTDEDLNDSAAKKRTLRSFLLSPREYWERIARENDPQISDDQLRKLLDYVEGERQNDPLLPNETLDKMPGQMTAGSMGANLEMGTYICHAIGAFPYTNVKFRWKEILESDCDLNAEAQTWTPLTKAFQQLEFKFLDKVDSRFACSIREEGRLESFRAFLRKMWNTVGGSSTASHSQKLALDFRDELTYEFNVAQSEWDSIDRDLVKWASRTLAGAIATGTFAPAFSAVGFAALGMGEIIQAEMKRREFRRKIPMSVFIDLNSKT